MKLIHCADIHADSKMGTHFTDEQAKERREEIVSAFAAMVSYAKANDVRAILISGDLFDTRETQQKKLKQRIAWIISQNPDIDFLYLRGNHDEGVEFGYTENLTNIRRFTKESWTEYKYENVHIYGREFGQTIPASVYSELVVDPAQVNILMLHGQIASYQSKNDAPDISLPSLTNKHLDYLALGHIHQYKKEKLDSRCVWCYSGCLEGRGFDEAGDKGFVVLDITGEGDTRKIETEFVSVARRKVHDIPVPLSGSLSYNDVMAAIESAVAYIDRKDIVQVVLTGEITEDTEIEIESYMAALKDRFYCFRIKNHTETKIDYEKYQNDVSLKGEFIRLVQERTDLSEDDKGRIIMTGIKALAGRL